MGTAAVSDRTANHAAAIGMEPGWFRAACAFCDGEGSVPVGTHRVLCDWCDGTAEMVCCAQGIPVKPYVDEDVSVVPHVG